MENFIEKFYDEGVGEEGENFEKMDDVFVEVVGGVVELWRDYVNKLLRLYEEYLVEIGFGLYVIMFEKVNYLVNLVLWIYYMRYEEGMVELLL